MKLFALVLAAALCASTAWAGDAATEILAEVNLARTRPRHYAEIVEAQARDTAAAREAVRFLKSARPLAALSWSDGISRAALCHVLDLGVRGSRGHTGSRGESPWSRMARFGQKSGWAAENISYGVHDPRGIVVSLLVDEGVRNRAHRRNLFGPAFRVAGVAFGSHARFGAVCVMDFAGGFREYGVEAVAVR